VDSHVNTPPLPVLFLSLSRLIPFNSSVTCALTCCCTSLRAVRIRQLRS